jgi:His Kinase A (phospho-acceptor) domain
VAVVPKWLLPTVSEIIAQSDPTWASPGDRDTGPSQRAHREWHGAIAALAAMLQQQPIEASERGLILSGPVPVFNPAGPVTQFLTWALTPHPLDTPFWLPFQLLPAADPSVVVEAALPPTLSLLPGDPLAAEQFCLVLTPRFSVVMAIGHTLTATPTFMFSFLPDVVERVWSVLRPRVLLTSAAQVQHLDAGVLQFPPVVPNYQTVMQFSRLMLAHLPEASATAAPKGNPEADNGDRKRRSKCGGFAVPMAGTTAHRPEPESVAFSPAKPQSLDVELLQAIAHEVRTPLTTIRTLTRLLLKRQDLPADVLKRLSTIDRECSEQIDRFGLIFRAVELETTSTQTARSSLTRTSLSQVFADSIPRWQQQAAQRGMTLDVVLPQHTPMVVSDPSMLDQALTSLIERFTRSLPAESHIWVEVTPAGHQLKVQLRSQLPTHLTKSVQSRRPKLRSLGQVLMFQPETGSLSLNMAVTKNLFQSLGGKLIVRQRPEQGEIMTVFLPLEKSPSIILDPDRILEA